MGVRDRTHVRTCLDVSVHVLVSQLGSGKEAELGSEGQEGLGVCLVLRGKLGSEGIVGRADPHPVHLVQGGLPMQARGEPRAGEQSGRESGPHYFCQKHGNLPIFLNPSLIMLSPPLMSPLTSFRSSSFRSPQHVSLLA